MPAATKLTGFLSAQKSGLARSREYLPSGGSPTQSSSSSYADTVPGVGLEPTRPEGKGF